MLTTFELDEYVFDALQAGAAGFLIKDSEPADMLRAVRLVAAGESLLSPSVTRRVGRWKQTSPLGDRVTLTLTLLGDLWWGTVTILVRVP